MEIKQLRYFLEICEKGSFSKAAEALYITQQGLSKAIKNFESELEVSLFYRTASGVEKTEYGKLLQNKAIQIIKETDGIISEINHLKSLQKGTLKVAFSLGVISALPTDFIADFKSSYPGIELLINEYQDLLCEEAVLSEEADIGFTIGPVDSAQYEAFPVIEDKMCLLVNQANPLAEKDAVDFKDIRNEKFISVNQNFKLYHNFVSKCRTAGFEPEMYLLTKEMILIHNLSRNNKAIGVSVDFISHEISGVKSVLFKDPACNWQVCLIVKKGDYKKELLKTFIDYTLENV
jgi:DNA-binding transcriptional LysR family regulator